MIIKPTKPITYKGLKLYEMDYSQERLVVSYGLTSKEVQILGLRTKGWPLQCWTKIADSTFQKG